MDNQILVIDDDPRLLDVMKIRFEAGGLSVCTACTGEEGIQANRRIKPKAIVLDVNMPGMDGLEVCRHVRAEDPSRHVPILILSAVSHEMARAAAMKAGANRFFGKPYNPAEVIQAIQSLIS